MSDISYRNHADFRNLDGQSKPSEELLEDIFKNARFDTRFYTETQVYSNPHTSPFPGPARILISAALEPAADALSDFDAWYREEHLDVLSRAPGYIRTRRYELVSGTSLDEFERTSPKIPKYLALHEFDCGDEGLPWKELGESAETEWAERVMGNLVREEVGWYTRKRVYEEEEWGSVGK
jgi:hypothetical protein